jgi:23S rRNA (cytosine1962-C5)-methyltransferase
MSVEPAPGVEPAVLDLGPVADLHLAPSKDRPVLSGHPWVFSGAIRDLDPNLEPGSIVRVRAASGELLGTGYANPRCTIAVRMLTRGDEPVDAGLIAARVAAALDLRRRLVGADTTACRLINGEGDGLPGLLVDRYDDALVVQCLTAGADRLKPWLVAELVRRASWLSIVERSEGSVRGAEGLPSRSGVLRGEPPGERIVRENGLRFAVTPGGGQKTGHFCDQRPNRMLCRQLAAGRRVLDAFAYGGGFAVHAGSGGAARVTLVESSQKALATARDNWEANGLAGDRADFVPGDVWRFLRDTPETFDLFVLDPPALVRHRKDVAPGARAYKDLHLRSFRRAEAGALVLTFTCSQHVDRALFRKIVLGAANDAGRDVQILGHLGPGPDHPVALAHPEGEYLHGLLLRVA